MSLTESEVSRMVRDAIATANYKANGAPFKPFKIKAGNASDFTSIWFNEARGNNDIRFYGFNGQRTDGYLPLGDVAVNSKELKMDEAGTLLFSVHPDFANDGSAPLAHPVGFEWLLDDYGTSQDDKNLFYWRPIAPQGYSALGICFTPTAAQPDPARYWCVNNSFVEETGRTTAWNDSGTHWTHNGNLDAPTLKNEQLNGTGLLAGQVRIIPNTFFSQEGTSMRALAVRADQCYLSVPPVSAISPTFDGNAGDGSFTDFGLDGNIAVLPFIGVKNRSPKAPVDSPFYYLACEPYFHCLKSISTSGGGSEKLAYEVGTSHTESSQYKETTGLTIGASLGYTAGQASGGVGGSISVSFSKTWEVGNESSTTDSSSQTEETIVNFKAQPTTQIWQRRKHMAVYSTDGVKIAEVDYNTKDMKFVPE